MKKGNIIVYTIAVALIVIAATLSTSEIPMNSTENHVFSSRGMPFNYTILAEIPILENNLTRVYKIVPDEYNSSWFEDIADEFGLSGEVEFVTNSRLTNTYVIKDSNRTLEYRSPAGVWGYTSNEAYPAVTLQPNLPDDGNAKDIAEEFLKDNGFWSDNMTFSHIVYSYQRKCNKTTEEIIEEFVLTKTVCFEKTLDDIELGGVGSKCMVRIGENGTIVSFVQPSRTYEANDTALVITPVKALENLTNRGGIRSLHRTRYSGRNVTITNISFCYYVDSLLKEPGIVNLCYRYKGNFSDGEDFLVYADAIEFQ